MNGGCLCYNEKVPLHQGAGGEFVIKLWKGGDVGEVKDATHQILQLLSIYNIQICGCQYISVGLPAYDPYLHSLPPPLGTQRSITCSQQCPIVDSTGTFDVVWWQQAGSVPD